MHANKLDHSKRATLFGRPGRLPEPVRPPWTNEQRVADACTRCGHCIDACPEGVLALGQGGFPQFDPHLGHGMCTFCGACADACAENVFDRSPGIPWSLSVRIDPHGCLAHAGIHCASCREACDAGAIRMTARIGGPPLPDVLDEACTGCGACVGICPGRAVALHPRQRPEAAQ